MEPFNVDKALEAVKEPFSPVDLAYVDDFVLRCSLVKGEFHWHRHADQDELFLCHSGRLCVETPEKRVELLPGEGVVVPKGVEHRTFSAEGAVALVFERRETKSKGD
jgi:mannose-6-phosphate isomerase-like protein (cupin superfamily)